MFLFLLLPRACAFCASSSRQCKRGKRFCLLCVRFLRLEKWSLLRRQERGDGEEEDWRMAKHLQVFTKLLCYTKNMKTILAHENDILICYHHKPLLKTSVRKDTITNPQIALRLT
jgi:hypothetical protein